MKNKFPAIAAFLSMYLYNAVILYYSITVCHFHNVLYLLLAELWIINAHNMLLIIINKSPLAPSSGASSRAVLFQYSQVWWKKFQFTASVQGSLNLTSHCFLVEYYHTWLKVRTHNSGKCPFLKCAEKQIHFTLIHEHQIPIPPFYHWLILADSVCNLI